MVVDGDGDVDDAYDGIVSILITLPETNIGPKNGWLEYYFPIGEAYFQGRKC